MFEAVRKNKRISQVILAIIIVPFAFFGMDAFFTERPGSSEVAKVGDYSITAAEFDQALRVQQDRMREAFGADFDREMVDSPEFRRSVLENLINQRALLMHASENRMMVSEQQLQNAIASLPAFQGENGFSLELYERAVRAQGMSPAMFEARMAQDVRVRQILQAVGESAFTGKKSVKQFVLAQLEEREVREWSFPASRYLDEVTIDDATVKAYYDENPTRFELPPRLRAQYVVLDHEAVLANVEIEEAAVREYYDGNQEQFGQPEERRARHILVGVAGNAPDDEVEQARSKAESIVARLREDAGRFADLAREESDDPGSASAGGDLGFFGPGAMVGEFEEAAFSLEPGDISDPVRTDFGFHVIEVTAVTPATIRPFDEVRDEVAEELRRQEASRRFPVLAEQFANTTYEQPDSLEPAAESLGLPIRETGWIVRRGGQVGPYTDERLLNALFSADVREAGENVEAIEVERGTMVSARVVDYEAARLQPFEDVRDEIVMLLRNEKAGDMAREQGEETLTRLVGGSEVEGQWGDPTTIQRGNPTLAPAAMQAIFGASESELPAYAGALLSDGGYGIFRIESVRRPDLDDDDPRLLAVAQQYDRLMAEKDSAAFVASLRDRYKVEIRASALRSGER